MNRLLALFAFAVFCGFLAILAFKVPSPDLLAVIALTIGLAGYDFVTTTGRRND